MSYSTQTEAYRLPWFLRLTLIAVGTVIVSLLVTAATLTPNPLGQGTHQQLGLPPCTFKQLPMFKNTVFERAGCPSCGMTTSWAHMVRGHVFQSFAANAGGALLAWAAAVTGPWTLMSGLLGHWFLGVPNEKIALAVVATIVLVTLIDWSLRLLS